MVWMFVSSQNSCWNPNLHKMTTVLVDRAFEKWLDHKSGALLNGISALIKEIPQFPRPFHYVRIQHEAGTSPDQAGTLISDFQEENI